MTRVNGVLGQKLGYDKNLNAADKNTQRERERKERHKAILQVPSTNWK